MIEDFVKKHVAVSSLESPEHAMRKDPGIITCTWFIGKRCNYDCSYCASFYHDNYSPHVTKESAFNFIDQLDAYAYSQKKKFKMGITGGEPFVHPDFLNILAYAKQKPSLTQLSVTTNGSVPLQVYLEATKYLTNITISLHLEQPQQVTDRTLNTIIELNRVQGLFLNVNLMALPGRLNQIKTISKHFAEHNVNFITRLIEPPFEDKDNRVKKGDKQAIQKVEETFMSDKILGKKVNRQNLDSRTLDYYTKSEIEYISNQKVSWKNIRLHTETDILELNTDELKANGLNTWLGWQCYIGIDSLYIQHNGEIYRGNCLLGDKLGDIGSEINWPNKPFTCTATSCGCNADMIVRKAKNPQYTNIIS
jgi:MoaA/NifB/PqqE/SkfB family radical SAM enzyme